jgi:hypothetical protein
MEDQYSEIEIPMTDGLKINGTLTLAENIGTPNLRASGTL